MLESRASRSAVRAVVVMVSALAVAVAACAGGGEGGGPSQFTSADPPIAVSMGGASGGGASADDAASAATAPSSMAMADGCADAADAATLVATAGSQEAESPFAPEASDEEASEEAGDDAPESDADEDASSTGAGLAPVPVIGDLVVTEIMFQPSGPEPESEWFEIYNQSSGPVLLSGLTIEDGYLDTQTIPANPAVVAQPGQYLLLVRSLPGAQAALLPSAAIAYAYGTGVPDDEGIELDAGPFGELTLLNGNSVLVDIPYGQWGVQAPGQSIELGTSATTQSDPSGWCIAENPWASGSDDGTPGAPSDCQ